MKGSISLKQLFAMFFHEPPDFVQLVGAEAVVRCQRYRVQPKLGLEIITRDVNVRRLHAFTAVKMKAIRANAQHSGHVGGCSR